MPADGSRLPSLHARDPTPPPHPDRSIHPTPARHTPAPLRAGVRRSSGGRAPWLSLTLLGLLAVVGAVTMGADPVTEPERLAWAWGDGLTPELILWWVAHDGGFHLAANAVILALFAPSLERYVGPLRLAGAVVGGNLVGLLAHGGLNLTDRPLIGASAMVYAVVAYSLVVGWHAPFETRRGPRRRLWPGQVFHAVLVFELLRWGVQVAAERPPGGAAAHLGGIAAGVLICGVAHRRWPAGPASRQARGRGAHRPVEAEVVHARTEPDRRDRRDADLVPAGVSAHRRTSAPVPWSAASDPRSVR